MNTSKLEELCINTIRLLAVDMVEAFLNATFSGEIRHSRRVQKVRAIEQQYCKEAE